jgi:hypothetical protein
MLTQQEILNEVFALPTSEQRKIAEKIQEKIHQENEPKDFTEDEFDGELTIDERIAITKNLAGCLKPEAKYTPMTKAEERELIEEYLLEKYS